MPRVRGTLGTGDGLVGTPASCLVDLVAAGIHGAIELAPPSSGVPSTIVER